MSAKRKQEKKSEAGYDKYIEWKRAGLPLWFVAQILLLLMVAFYWIPMGFGTMARF